MITYAELRETQKKEMESAAIVPVSDTFYEELSQLLEQKKREMQSEDSLLAMREYENIKKIIQTIQNKREEKIALMALRSDSEGKGLSGEERRLLQSMAEAVRESRTNTRGILKSGKIVSEKRVHIVKDVDKYKGLNNAVYGPFKKGENQVLPSEEANWLIKASMAEEETEQ